MTDSSVETLAGTAMDSEKAIKQAVVYKTSWTVKELYAAEFPPLRWAVRDLIPEGLSALGGRPKIGKSWLALQIACAVGTGGMVLDTKVDKGRVLYLALEDSPRRLQDRCNKMHVPGSADIEFLTRWKSFTDGGMDALMKTVESQEYQLIIVDTLSKIIGRIDQNDLEQTSNVIGDIQSLVNDAQITLLTLDHHRKTNGFEPNPIDDFIGSTGKALPLDGALGLYRQNGKRERLLMATGREIEEKSLALIWDRDTYCWQSLGDADDVKQDSFNGEVIRGIRELMEVGELTTQTKIAKHIGAHSSHVSRALSELVTSGKLIRGEKVGKEQPYHVFR